MTPELERFSSVIKKMLPIYDGTQGGDNLTEIPTQHKTMHQRFLTIAESEPFGPVDASKIYGLMPAKETLESLTEPKEDSEQTTRKEKVVVGQQKQGDRAQFHFKSASSGQVGFRYGAPPRDRKKDRGVGFERSGRMVYTA